MFSLFLLDHEHDHMYMRIAVSVALRKRSDILTGQLRVGTVMRQSRDHGPPIPISIGWNDMNRLNEK